MKLCIIVLERPGCGLSTSKPDRTLLGWADDVVEFSEIVGFSQFSVVGFSAGGPFALACAFKVPYIIFHFTPTKQDWR